MPPSNAPKPADSTVLIVEDHPPTLELLQACLEGVPGLRIVGVSNGRDAIEKVRDDPPDLVLLDIMMPRMSGFEVCRHIKGDPRTRDITVVMVTALDDRSDYDHALQCGADEFLRKPISRAELITRVGSLLRMRRLRRQLARLDSTTHPGADAEHGPAEGPPDKA